MLREAAGFETGAMRAYIAPRPAEAQVSEELPAAAPETAEQQITRLTWSVLDGSASLGDRQRLAELVNAQHGVRRRIDR